MKVEFELVFTWKKDNGKFTNSESCYIGNSNIKVGIVYWDGLTVSSTANKWACRPTLPGIKITSDFSHHKDIEKAKATAERASTYWFTQIMKK